MNNAHQRLVATVKLGHVIANMRAAMYRTGRQVTK